MSLTSQANKYLIVYASSKQVWFHFPQLKHVKQTSLIRIDT